MDSFSSNMSNLNEPRNDPEGLSLIIPRSHLKGEWILSPDVVDLFDELSNSRAGNAAGSFVRSGP